VILRATSSLEGHKNVARATYSITWDKACTWQIKPKVSALVYTPHTQVVIAPCENIMIYLITPSNLYLSFFSSSSSSSSSFPTMLLFWLALVALQG
jgi:hypothetical protein